MILYSCEGSKLLGVYDRNFYQLPRQKCETLVRRKSLRGITSLRESGLFEFFKCVVTEACM